MASLFSRNNQKKYPLKFVLIAPFITLTVLTVGLIGYLSYSNSKKAVNHIGYQLRKEVTNHIESHLDTFLGNPRQINLLNAAAMRQGWLKADDPRMLEKHFWHQLQIFESVTSIYFGNTRGGLIDSGREGAAGRQYIIATDNFQKGPFRKYATDNQGNRTDLLLSEPDFDARTRMWYKLAVEKKTDVWSPAYILFTGQDMAVSASRPVYDNQQRLLGVLSVDLFLSHISHFLQNLIIGENGRAFIIDRSGFLIASSTGEKPFTLPTAGAAQRRLKATESRAPSIRYAAEVLNRGRDEAEAFETERGLEFEAEGRRYFLQISPVQRAPGLDWLIAVVVSEQDAIARITANRHLTLLLAAVALCIAILVGLFTAQRIVGPIYRLDSAANELAEGKWEQRVDNSSRLVEVNRLNRSFHRMADQLQQMMRNLSHEIAERKSAEEALRASHERFLTVLDSIDATIYVADMETHEVLFMNNYMIESFGRDMIGEKCHEVFRGEPQRCSHCTNDQLIDENGRPAGVCIWQAQNPITGKWYVNYDRAIEWTDGRWVRLQIATDVTEFKSMEEELRQAHKMEAIGTLAGGIAHDFNNLLMGIQGRASLMALDLDSSDPHSKQLAAIDDYVRSAMGLTRQLLGLVRGGKYEVKPIDLNDLVRKSATLFGRTRKEIRIHTRMQASPLVVEADRSQLEQVLLNLYVNAWQATPEGGGDLYLETSAEDLDELFCKPHKIRPGRYVRISVTDRGIGMDESTRQRVFDPFFTTKAKGRGTGLGLASAYGIVKNHGGLITVVSTPGSGTTFRIYLPASRRDADRDKTHSEAPATGNETILLIDDEEMILDVGRAMLERLGYRVVIAASGEQALGKLRESQETFDLVILDMIMPGMDGRETFERIRKLRSKLPVIISSGYSLEGQASEILQNGADGFIQKPFSISELSKKIRNILSKRGFVRTTT